MQKIFDHHIFFCTHQRDADAPKPCCAAQGADDLRLYAKAQVAELKLKRVRVNNAGCLQRCTLGPMLVIYPEGTWYQYHSREDIDEILSRHVAQGDIVTRLLK